MDVIVQAANVTLTTNRAPINWRKNDAAANHATSGFCEYPGDCRGSLGIISTFVTHTHPCHRLSKDVTCALLEKDFKCSCTGCECKPPPKCDKKAKKFCSDAYKKPCSGKSPTCGACIKGYASDGKFGCGAWKNCNALGKIEDRAGTAKNQPVCGRDFKCRYN